MPFFCSCGGHSVHVSGGRSSAAADLHACLSCAVPFLCLGSCSSGGMMHAMHHAGTATRGRAVHPGAGHAFRNMSASHLLLLAQAFADGSRGSLQVAGAIRWGIRCRHCDDAHVSDMHHKATLVGIPCGCNAHLRIDWGASPDSDPTSSPSLSPSAVTPFITEAQAEAAAQSYSFGMQTGVAEQCRSELSRAQKPGSAAKPRTYKLRVQLSSTNCPRHINHCRLLS